MEAKFNRYATYKQNTKRTQMTIEELLKPRWKIIADFPGSHRTGLNIGDVVQSNNIDAPEVHFLADYYVNLNNYPAIFKKLEWWEERKEEDMPKFLRFKKNNEIFKFFITLHNIQTIYHERYPNQLFHLSDFEPATEEEYLAQERSERPQI